MNFLKTKLGLAIATAVLAALGVVAGFYCPPCVSVVDALKNSLPTLEQPVSE